MATIFDGVVTKENDYTNLLRNLLERDSRAAAEIISWLIQQEVSTSEAAKLVYTTQRTFAGEGGREIPDLILEGEDFQCLVEVKVDPDLGLTNAQRGGYAGCFSAGHANRHICFLVPNTWSQKHKNDTDQVTEALRGKGIHVHVRRWEALAKEIGRRILKNPTSELLIEIVSFWKWRFEVPDLSDEERRCLQKWSGEVFSAMRQLEKTIVQTKGIFDAQGDATELETDVTQYGFYLKRGTGYMLWVGIWKEAQAPVTIGFQLGRKAWIKPSEVPGGFTISKSEKYHLWAVQSDCWDDPHRLFEDVRKFRARCFPN